ncbi:glycosyltransferase family 39 protein [Brumimicrobium salinarum]|nr:glycosyltransferase family 39 protein [Brumimicrobium salinarum]
MKVAFHDKRFSIIALLLVFLHFTIKVIYLDKNDLAGDEPFSVYHAQMNISSIIELLSTGNNPPLYEIILHIWIKLFGINEYSVRFLSLLFSSITAMYIFLIGRKFLNIHIAFYAVILFISSNYHTYFAQEARVYALFGLLCTMSMYHFLKLLSNYQASKHKNIYIVFKRSIPLILINTALIYAHYFGFFILITQLVFSFVNLQLIKARWKSLLIIGLGILILYIPNIVVIFQRISDTVDTGTWLTAPNGIHALYDMVRKFSNAPVVATFVLLTFAAALVKIIFLKKTKLPLPHQLICFWFVLIFFSMFILSYWYPMFLDRYLMPASIAFYLLLAICIDFIIQKSRIKFVIPLIICGLFIFTAKPFISNKRAVKQTVNYIIENKNSNTQVYIAPKNFSLTFAYHFDRNIFSYFDSDGSYKSIEAALQQANIFTVNNAREIQINNTEELIFLDAAVDLIYPKNNIKETLDTNFNLENKQHFHEIFDLYIYKSNSR